MNLKSRVHLWKAKAKDLAYWKNSINAAWFTLGIRIARDHATGWYHSMRSLTTCFWSLQNNQERTLFAIKFNALKKLVTISWHLDCTNQPTWNNWSPFQILLQIIQTTQTSARPPLLMLNLGLSTWCSLKQTQTFLQHWLQFCVLFVYRFLMPDKNFSFCCTCSYLFSVACFSLSYTSSSQKSSC